ncbi:MAG: hypothetical protein OEV44_05465 [Spirochaetota bacterium]|nr:hypothetical protein [Spirochaetota bacterium]
MLICHYEKGSEVMSKNIKKNVCPTIKDWNFVFSDGYLNDDGDIAWNSDETTESR